MDPLWPRVRSDAGNVGNAELLMEASMEVWILQLWSILKLEFNFKQCCVLGSHSSLTGRCHLFALMLGKYSALVLILQDLKQ